MVDERKRQLMQEALDDNLTPEAQHMLREHLKDSPEEAAYYTRLKQIDMLLQTAPFERAPARLALRIMARLTEEVQVQQKAQDWSSLTLTLSVAMVTVVMMPMLVAASWMVINQMAKAEVLTSVIEQTVALLVMLIEALEQLLGEAQNLASTNPEAAAMITALVPLTLLGFVRYMETTFLDDNNHN